MIRELLIRARSGRRLPCGWALRKSLSSPPGAPGARLILAVVMATGMPAWFSEGQAQTVKLNSAPAFVGSSDGVREFRISPDGSKVIYLGDLTTINTYDLYSASTTAAGSQVRLSDSLSGRTVLDYVVTPDFNQVIFGRFNTTNSLFDVQRAGTTTTGTETTLVAGAATTFVGSFLMSPDGARVVFEASNGADESLVSALVTPPATPIVILPPSVTGARAEKTQLISTASGVRAIFDGDLDTGGGDELFSAAIGTASSRIKLNTTPTLSGDVSGGSLTRFQVTTDGETVIYIGDLETDGVTSLYRASTTAPGTQTRLSTALHGDSDVLGMVVAPTTNRVLYLADLLQDDVFVIFEASTTGLPNQRPVFYPTANYFGIRDVAMTPDEQHLIFRGSLTTSGINDLYCTPSNFLFEPRRVTELLATEDVNEFKISPDSSFIVYTQSTSGTLDETLWAVSSTGQYAPVQIGPVPAGQVIEEFEIKPDNSGVVYTAYVDGVYLKSLYSVPIPDLDNVPNPIAATPALPIPGAELANQAPVLTLIGKSKVRTPGKPVTIRGLATDAGGVKSVLVSYKKVSGSGKKRTVVKSAALAGNSWSLKFRAKEKVSKLTVVAVGNSGLRSRPVLVKVVKG